jgi:tRNA uridine 5-carbamoylmethylation protein Kti12
MPCDFAYLVTGIPGAGKTTVSAALARRFRRAAHIEADLLQEMIVSGGRWPGPEPDEEADDQLALRARNAAVLANAFAASSFVPVIDDVVVGPTRLALYRDRVEVPTLHVIVLAPPLEVALARDDARGYKRVGRTWAHLDAYQRRELGGIGIWIDTGTLDVDETVDEVLRLTGQA